MSWADGTGETLDYVRAFRCLGAECEDNCCRGWEVNVDQAHHDRWAACFAAGSEERTIFERSVRLNPEPTGRRFARVSLEDDGTCPFLEADGLCVIHRRHGQALLSETCAAYPRVVSRHQATVEMAGALSCPEMVRACFSDAYCGKVVAFSSDELPTGALPPAVRTLPELPADPYERHFDAVRQTMSAILRGPGISLTSRLLQLLEYTHRIAVFYHRDCAEPGPRLALERQRSIARPPASSSERGGGAEPLGVMVVQALLTLRLHRFPEEPFAEIVREVLAGYAGEVASLGPADAAGVDFPPATLAAAFANRRARIEPRFGRRIEHYLGRYLENCLHREWFIAIPDPYTFTHLVAVRVAVLRFLLYSQPSVAAMAEERPADAFDELEHVAVRVTYRFCRAFDHDLGFQEAIYRALAEQDLLRFELAPDLLQF